MFTLPRILLLVLGIFMIVIVWATLRNAIYKLDPIELQVGPKTTMLTEPLREDGTVDYREHFRRQLAAGVDPAENAAVDLVAALGPDVLDEEIRAEMLDALGLAEADSGSGFRSLADFAETVDPARLGLQPVSPDSRKKYRELVDSIQQFRNYRFLAGDPDGLQERLEEQKKLAGSVPLGVLAKKLDQAVGHPWTQASAPVLAEWLDLNARAVDRFLDAAGKGRFYLPLISQPGDSLLEVRSPSEFPIVQLGKAALARAMQKLADGKASQASGDIQAVFRWARLLDHDWSPESFRAASALQSAAARASMALAASAHADEQLLNAHAQALAALEPLGPTDRLVDTSLRYLTLSALMLFYSLEDRPGDVTSQVREQVRNAHDLIDWNRVAIQLNAWYDQMVTASRGQTGELRRQKRQALADSVGRYMTRLQSQAAQRNSFIGTIKSIFMDNQTRRELLTEGQAATLFVRTVFDPWSMQDRRISSVARLRLARIALAAKLYHGNNDSWPESIDQLVEAGFIPPQTVLDPFTLEKMKLLVANGVFQVYSVGPDLADNNGDDETDITFRQHQ
ncbi:MAG: hypothetical protein ACOCZE_10535 [Planctomycetota bacterium]